MICGIQKKEYMLPTKRSVMEGDTMTRTMKDRNMNIVSPRFLFGGFRSRKKEGVRGVLT
jgi:hypothetical protein